jgi:predicted RNA-binding protein associated with RNAse of E/G family
MSAAITVCKCDVEGREVWSYPGRILKQEGSGVLVEAFFDRDLVEVGMLKLARGDRFLEQYYFDRWYNIFSIYEGRSGPIKGWYCNIARPARLEQGRLCAEDLALDYVVLPDGSMQLLDEDEFHTLTLSSRDRRAARRALDDLRDSIAARRHPFAAP